MSVRASLAVCMVLACAGCQTGVGFGVAVTMRVDGRVSPALISAVQSLRVSSMGDEQGSYDVALMRTLQSEERFVYRPSQKTHIITLTVDALDSHDNVLLSGMSPTLALVAGATTSTEIVLTSGTSTPDFAGEDLFGVDFASVDFTTLQDLQTADLEPRVDGGTVVIVGGESISMPTGWSVSVLHDISADYTYNANDFSDSSTGDTDDNAPRRIVTLVSPFNEGIAVLAGRSIIEVPTTGAATLHKYTPPTPNGTTYPDIPRDLYFALPAGSIPARLLVAGNSSGNGDGIFTVTSAWAMSLLITSNNNGTVDFDATGVFQSKGTPETFYGVFSGGEPGTLERYEDNTEIVPSPYVFDAEVLSASVIGLVLEVATDMADGAQLATVTADGSYMVTNFPSTYTTHGYSLVTGALTRLPSGQLFSVLDNPSSLVELDTSNGKQTTLLSSLTTGWQWVHAAVPSANHVALGGQTQFVLLESNRTLNVDRVLLVKPPSSF